MALRSDDPNAATDRRAFLLGAGALLIGACTSEPDPEEAAPSPASTSTSQQADVDAPSTTAPDGTSTTSPESPGAAAELTPELFASLPTCILTASAAAGPFPSKAPIDRRDIHEDLPGSPLRIGIRTTDGNCDPIAGAVVDIWHTDATGDYSEYADNGSGKDEGEGSTFCRGAQTSNADGIVEFLTIYPGWYEGRTVHIHATTRLPDGTAFTTQFYLDEALTEAIHGSGAYATFGPPDTSWADDGLIGDPAADGTLMTTTASETRLGAGTLALINVGIEAA